MRVVTQWRHSGLALGQFARPSHWKSAETALSVCLRYREARCSLLVLGAVARDTCLSLWAVGPIEYLPALAGADFLLSFFLLQS